MAAITHGATHRFHFHPATLRTSVVLLTLGTAAIHASLGGMLFMANALGYVVLAIAMVAPGPATRWRWLIRLALIAFAAATIGGWVAFGPRFGLAYLDKAIEVALIGVLLIEQWQLDGGPIGVYRRTRRLVRSKASPSVARRARYHPYQSTPGRPMNTPVTAGHRCGPCRAAVRCRVRRSTRAGRPDRGYTRNAPAPSSSSSP